MNYYQKMYDLLIEGSLGLQRSHRIGKSTIRAAQPVNGNLPQSKVDKHYKMAKVYKNIKRKRLLKSKSNPRTHKNWAGEEDSGFSR